MLGTQEELAILGGPQAVGAGAVQPWPQVAAADKAAVMGVLERGVLWGAAAPEAMALQEEWAAYVGARHCLVTNSGTAALHMAVAAAVCSRVMKSSPRPCPGRLRRPASSTTTRFRSLPTSIRRPTRWTPI